MRLLFLRIVTPLSWGEEGATLCFALQCIFVFVIKLLFQSIIFIETAVPASLKKWRCGKISKRMHKNASRHEPCKVVQVMGSIVYACTISCAFYIAVRLSYPQGRDTGIYKNGRHHGRTSSSCFHFNSYPNTVRRSFSSYGSKY